MHPNPTPGPQILVDTLEAVSAVHQAVVRRAPGATEASAVDVHAVALFLFAQLYIRQARPRRARRGPGSARPGAACARKGRAECFGGRTRGGAEQCWLHTCWRGGAWRRPEQLCRRCGSVTCVGPLVLSHVARLRHGVPGVARTMVCGRAGPCGRGRRIVAGERVSRDA
jgi:hypothetical protein